MLVKIDAVFFFFIKQAALSTVDKEMENRTNNTIVSICRFEYTRESYKFYKGIEHIVFTKMHKEGRLQCVTQWLTERHHFLSMAHIVSTRMLSRMKRISDKFVNVKVQVF